MTGASLSQGFSYYGVAGDGPPLVLIHGMGGDHTVWDLQVEALGSNYRLIRHDILGHGRSDGVGPPWSYGQFALQIAELLDHLQVTSAFVCGFSLGGLIAQSFAVEYPERTRKLIVVSSPCKRSEAEQKAIEQRVSQVRLGGAPAVVEDALRRWFSPAFATQHPEVIAYWRTKTLANNPESYRAAYELYADCDRQLLGRLGEIRAPTLILTGDRDLGQPPHMAEEMARLIPNARHRILPGVPHMLPIEAADDLNAAIRQFFSSPDPTR